MKRITCAIALSFAFPAGAVLLAPGAGPLPPDIFTGQAPGALLANTGLEAFSSLTPAFTGVARAEVFRNGAGFLDFYYQVANNASSPDAINRLTASSFAGFSTDVGIRTDGSGVPLFVNGSVLAATVDRGVVGDEVGFNFPTPNDIAPGLTSVLLEIKTNATQFTSGNLAIINSSVAEVAAFAPAAAAMEPGVLALFGAGLALLGFGRRGFERVRRWLRRQMP
jgi:hypothetical protein